MIESLEKNINKSGELYKLAKDLEKFFDSYDESGYWDEDSREDNIMHISDQLAHRDTSFLEDCLDNIVDQEDRQSVRTEAKQLLRRLSYVESTPSSDD